MVIPDRGESIQDISEFLHFYNTSNKGGSYSYNSQEVTPYDL